MSLSFRKKIKCTFCPYESDQVGDFAQTREHTHIKKIDDGFQTDFDGRPTTTKKIREEKTKIVIAVCQDCFKEGKHVNVE